MKEIDLFLFLLDTKYPDLQKSEGIYDSFDCISRDSSAYIELKCRNTHYPTLLIEEMKYRKLITQAAERDLVPFYINSTPEGVFSFDLMEVPEPEWFNHNTGKLPVKRVDGIAIQIDETMMQQSPFLYATDILDEVLLDSALLRGIKPTCTYPFRVMVGEYCEFSIRDNGEQLVCDNGYHYRSDGTKSMCPECNGTGAKDRVSPYGTLLIKPQKGANQGDTVSPDKAMYYASPSVETPTFLRNEIAHGMSMAYEILHLKKTDNKVQGGSNLTATEVASDQKSLIAGIKQNCIQLFDMFEWCIDMIGLM